MKKLTLAVVFLSLSSLAQAATFTYTGDTTGGPTFTRPSADPDTAAILPALSGLGRNDRFQSFVFTVDTPGVYNFTSAQTFDGYLFFYQNSFSPTSPLTNALLGNDDDATLGIGFSSLSGINLTTNTSYILVTTGFDFSEFGTFTNTIVGPGNAVPGPEPSTTLGLLMLGVWGGGTRLKALRLKRKA
ncbi:PEP-CTERM sorting domain-containing protein [Anthocerotibacter panamensis]|uniref:PEP-CTERM sorting domain-containing protein n=1 Tax=Anthocerotibacter panamensis TaxID=2857077 RepID=UPI001C4017E7|nr:PEP-CTERM sorting domain-containing protein [Anthocerotibacter panamensis]